MTEKIVIRQNILQQLKQFSKHLQVKEKIEQDLYDQLYASEFWKSAHTVALYASMAHELNTKPIIIRALQEGKIVCLPKTFPSRKMDFFQITTETVFEKTSFGVEEPLSKNLVVEKEIDLIVVPGVGFQKNGYRVGYGGGFYDKYLANYHGKTVGFVFSCQVISEKIDFKETFDQRIEKLFFESEGTNE